jgi:hypothetical protein
MTAMSEKVAVEGNILCVMANRGMIGICWSVGWKTGICSWPIYWVGARRMLWLVGQGTWKKMYLFWDVPINQ